MTLPYNGNYPPGVTGNEPELTGDWGPCAICLQSEDECVCPECPVCGSQGRENCYREHGMVMTDEQIEAAHDVEKRREWAVADRYYARRDR